MARRRVTAVVKIQLPAGKATPAPPVGTALGPHGVQTMEFVKQYNAATEDRVGQVIPVEITIFEDRTFTFVLKTPPTPVLLRQAAGLPKGATNTEREAFMPTRGKKYIDAAKRLDSERTYAPNEAVDIVKSLAHARFDESVEL